MKKTIVIVVLSFLTVTIVVVGLFIYFIAYSSIEDVSQLEPYQSYIDKSLVVKQVSVIRRDVKHLHRFQDYYIDVAPDQKYPSDSNIVKRYDSGDKIRFHTAKKHFSYHVGESFYLIGSTTLDNGESIEFEYGTSFQYVPAIWETLDEFLARRAVNKDNP